MKNIFKKLGRFLAITRAFFVNLFTAIFLIYTIVFLVFLFSSDEEITTSDKVVIINPNGLIVEEVKTQYDINALFEANTTQLAYRDLRALIDSIITDDEIPGVLIDFSKTVYSGPSMLLNIASDLKRLQDADKTIIAYSDRLSTSSLIMASIADEVIMHPAGSINLGGLGGDAPYINELLGNIGITIHDYSQGQFKSANETLTRDNMSENDRLQRLELLNPIWGQFLSILSQESGVSVDALQDFSDNYYSFIPEAAFDNIDQAKAIGLIDQTMSFPEFRDYMVKRFGADEESEIDTYNHIFYQDYLNTINIADDSNESSQVVVIVAEGTISEGDASPGVIGADDAILQIRRAYNNSNTRAIVYRVNSPGGSIIASEMIRDELFAAKLRGIPVVVSMGDYAASGGVYIATPADYIFAEPYTITGSIGVAIAVPTLENLMDRLGVQFDGVSTSSSSWNFFDAMTEDQDALFRQWGARSYERFIQVVASSREEDPDYIQSIAGGRVWLGSRALDLNLIDEIGGIDAAVEKAAELAELNDYDIRYLEPELSFEEIIIKKLLEANITLTSKELFPTEVTSLVESIRTSFALSGPSANYICTKCLIKLP
jgi:protease-4